MMKKIILTLSLCILLSFSAHALTNTQYVSALEQRLFGVTYENESLPSRIDRIEMQIYDSSYAGSSDERLEKIDKIYPKSEFETGEVATNLPDNLNNPNNDYYTQEYPTPSVPSDYNNYPIINEIEEQIYSKNYSGEDIYKRLSRLEKELYGTEKTEESLQERVESLKSVLPKKHYERFATKDLGFEDFGLKTPTTYQYNSYSDLSDAITQLELSAFNRTYENDKTPKRLERLEHYYFGGITRGQTEKDRIARLASVAMSSENMENYFPTPKGAQWAGILMNLLVFGLGFLL